MYVIDLKQTSSKLLRVDTSRQRERHVCYLKVGKMNVIILCAIAEGSGTDAARIYVHSAYECCIAFRWVKSILFNKECKILGL